VLIAVHVLAVAHILHWRLAGRTLAPLELNEVMYTLELGIITAGFILMGLAVASVLVFGRFFCSWGCHILALQDLCAWILSTLRIRAKPVRSRALLLVGTGAMLYMFVWPQVRRLIEDRPLPGLHLRDDEGGWASFVTDDFWRNLPDPWIALLTFAVCGFVIVYVLGTRSFCLYACPYGALFGLADRVAPGRIKVDAPACDQCGVCTAVCESHVRVHEEIARFGSVVDPACLKDLDCIAACPSGALSFGWTRPSLDRSLRAGRRRLPSDFSIAEEVLVGAVFLASLAVFRGLYGAVPFLLALAIGGIQAYAAVLGVRLVGAADVRFNAFQLKRSGRLTRAGKWGIVVGVAMSALDLHSGAIRANELLGDRALERAGAANAAGDPEELRLAGTQAVGRLTFCAQHGLVRPRDLNRKLAQAHWAAGDDPSAEAAWTRAVAESRADLESRLDLAASYLKRGEVALAEPVLRESTTLTPRSSKDAAAYAHHRAMAHQYLASIAASRGAFDEAYAALEAAAVEQPGDAALLTQVAMAAAQRSDLDASVGYFRRAAEASPWDPATWGNLAMALEMAGRAGDAAECLRRAHGLGRSPGGP